MSFYGVGITGSVENARLVARRYGVRLYGIEPVGNLDTNGNARQVGARASLRYEKKLARWYEESGVQVNAINAVTPPELILSHLTHLPVMLALARAKERGRQAQDPLRVDHVEKRNGRGGR
jgi:hypothetical protein